MENQDYVIEKTGGNGKWSQYHYHIDKKNFEGDGSYSIVISSKDHAGNINENDAKGLKGWIYRKFSEQPVLVSDVRPDLRMKMVEEMLSRNGYFGSSASYELLYNKKNHKKARVDYFVNVAPPMTLTERVYTHLDIETLVEAINKI